MDKIILTLLCAVFLAGFAAVLYFFVLAILKSKPL